jgi:hypothetical protein
MQRVINSIPTYAASNGYSIVEATDGDTKCDLGYVNMLDGNNAPVSFSVGSVVLFIGASESSVLLCCQDRNLREYGRDASMEGLYRSAYELLYHVEEKISSVYCNGTLAGTEEDKLNTGNLRKAGRI